MLERLYIYIDRYLNRLRILFLKLRGAKIGKGVKSFGSFRVLNAKNLKIGNYSTINEGVFINCRNKVIIGEHCHISGNVQIHTGKLILEEIPRKHSSKEIIIESNVWLAAGCIISSGVTISKNSVIGANSVVINNIESNCLYAGNPAIKIKELDING